MILLPMVKIQQCLGQITKLLPASPHKLPVILSAQLNSGQSQPGNELMYQCQNLLRATTSKWVVLNLFNQFVSTYRVRIRSKKWWWPFFAWALNASMANAWNLFRTVQKESLGILEFQRQVVMTILTSFGRNKPEKSLAFSRNVASIVKLDTKNHILVKATSKYCRCKHDGGRSICLCQKCNVALHPNCFKDYHS